MQHTNSRLLRAASAAASLATLSVIAFFIVLLLVEWAAGCGETYTAADGQQYINGCIFLGARR